MYRSPLAMCSVHALPLPAAFLPRALPAGCVDGGRVSRQCSGVAPPTTHPCRVSSCLLKLLIEVKNVCGHQQAT